jgi:hypothetical protein
MKKLPDKPSELLRLALHDLELCERDPKYRIDMEDWMYETENTCHVCLAGSVLAKTCGVRTYDHWGRNNIVYDKMRAINLFRVGKIGEGLDYLGFGGEMFLWGYALVNCVPCDYKDDPELFKLQMLELSYALENAGL